MPDTTALEQLISEMKQGCLTCPWKSVKSCTVGPDGPTDAEVMVIGRNPGQQEDREGSPFFPEAPGGRLLNIFLAASGINRSRCYVSNLAKCQGGKGDPAPTPEVYTTCSPWILKEIELLQPRVIIVLGNDSYQWILGLEGSVTVSQGVLLPTRFGDVKAIPLSHPGYWARRPSYFEETIIREVAPVVRQHLIDLKIQGLHPVYHCIKCDALYIKTCPECGASPTDHLLRDDPCPNPVQSAADPAPTTASA